MRFSWTSNGRLGPFAFSPQDRYGILAMLPCRFHVFIQYLTLLFLARFAIPRYETLKMFFIRLTHDAPLFG